MGTLRICIRTGNPISALASGFSGCVTAGRRRRARRMAAALALHIGGMAEDGEAIPAQISD